MTDRSETPTPETFFFFNEYAQNDSNTTPSDPVPSFSQSDALLGLGSNFDTNQQFGGVGIAQPDRIEQYEGENSSRIRQWQGYAALDLLSSGHGQILANHGSHVPSHHEAILPSNALEQQYSYDAGTFPRSNYHPVYLGHDTGQEMTNSQNSNPHETLYHHDHPSYHHLYHSISDGTSGLSFGHFRDPEPNNPQVACQQGTGLPRIDQSQDQPQSQRSLLSQRPFLAGCGPTDHVPRSEFHDGTGSRRMRIATSLTAPVTDTSSQSHSHPIGIKFPPVVSLDQRRRQAIAYVLALRKKGCPPKEQGRKTPSDQASSTHCFECINTKGCEWTFSKDWEWLRHLRLSYLTELWQCPCCFKFCHRLDNLADHYQSCHSRGNSTEQHPFYGDQQGPSTIFLAACSIQLQVPFLRKCGFCPRRRRAWHGLEDFTNHVSDHFINGSTMSQWVDYDHKLVDPRNPLMIPDQVPSIPSRQDDSDDHDRSPPRSQPPKRRRRIAGRLANSSSRTTSGGTSSSNSRDQSRRQAQHMVSSSESSFEMVHRVSDSDLELDDTGAYSLMKNISSGVHPDGSSQSKSSVQNFAGCPFEITPAAHQSRKYVIVYLPPLLRSPVTDFLPLRRPNSRDSMMNPPEPTALAFMASRSYLRNRTLSNLSGVASMSGHLKKHWLDISWRFERVVLGLPPSVPLCDATLMKTQSAFLWQIGIDSTMLWVL